MSVLNVLNASIYSTLTGGTALTALLSSGTAVYSQQAPAGAVLPYVVFSLQAGGPVNMTKSDMRDEIMFVRGYATGQAVAGSMDAQISALLHKKSLTVTGFTNFWTARETDLQLVEQTPAGEQVFMAGALYRIRLDD